MSPVVRKHALIFAAFSLTFVVFAVGNIFVAMANDYRDPGPPPALQFQPTVVAPVEDCQGFCTHDVKCQERCLDRNYCPFQGEQ